MEQKIYDLILVEFSETEEAYLVGDSDRESAVWLPKSEVKRGGRRAHAAGYWSYEFEVPEWLAIREGLI